jgi:ABC-2 type transport system ATP-binding protein
VKAAEQRPVVVETRRLSKRYGSLWAVRDLNLRIREGELFGLLGPNGAGKTTLFSILSCQLKPTQGDALVSGLSVASDSKAVKRLIGIVPQQAAAYEKLTAWENMMLFAELYGLDARAAYRRSHTLLGNVGLQERAHDRVSTFSGGMKHRLNIILGIVHDPQIVFFDEPTTGLDPIARLELWEIIRSLQRARKTIVLTTHYMQEAEDLCNRVAIIDRGQVVAEGNPKKMGGRSLEEIFFKCTTIDSPTGQRVRRSGR